MADDAAASTPSAPAAPATPPPAPTAPSTSSTAGDAASLPTEEARARSTRRRGPRASLPRRADGPPPRPARKSGRKPDKRDAKTTTKSSDVLAPAAAPAPAAPLSPLEQAVAAIHAGDPLVLPAKLDVNKRTPRGDVLLVEACRYARANAAATLIQQHNADVNLSSANKAANRSGLTPLIAACMALQPTTVELLLRQPGVDLLHSFGKVNAAAACLVFSVANGRTEQQNAAAIDILELLVDHAQRTDQLEALLTAQADHVNPLLHVAAALANWRAVKLLQDKQQQFGVPLTEANRNARGHTALHSLEMNAFQGRNLLFCEPPRPAGISGGGGVDGKKGKRRQQKRKGRQQDSELEAAPAPAALPEPEAEADRQTFTRSRPDRAVEAKHVTRTVMELAKSTGIESIFSRKGDSGVRSILIKSLVLAELGVMDVANRIAALPDDRQEKPVYLDGLLYSAAGLYPLAVKNPKEYKKLWQQALPVPPLAPKGSSDGDTALETPPPPAQLTPEAFKLITDTLLSHRSLSRRVKVWSIILMNALAPYGPKKEPLGREETPTLAQCSELSFYRRISETLYRSGVKLLFCIFDRTDIEEDESYDEEIEFHLIIALFELLLQLFTPFARAIRDDEAKGATPKPLGVLESFRLATEPARKLWPMVLAGLDTLDDAIASPQRFSLLLHVLQVFEQLEQALRADEEHVLKKLFGIMRTFVRQEASKKRLDEYVSTQVRLLHAVSNAFPLPTAFIDRLSPLKDKIDVLLRSDPKILGLDLYALASAGDDLIRLEHKVDYLGVLAEEHNGSVSVSISRASGANYVDFILQQVLSASPRHLMGELNVTLINEPGVGVGVVREFFQIVQSCFFSPGFSSPPDELETKPASHVSEIGSQWLEEARAQSSPRNNSRSRRRNKLQASRTEQGSLTTLFPLFEYLDAADKRRDELRVVHRRPVVTKATLDAKKEKGELSLTGEDLVANKERDDSLGKMYRCVGRLLGLAIRNHQPLNANFPLAFWQFMFGQEVTWEACCLHNQVFQRSLELIMDHDFACEPLELQFEYTTEVDVVSADGETVETSMAMEMELEPGRGQEKVTNDNKAEYVRLRALRFFFGSERGLYDKIRQGLVETIRPVDLKLFQPAELQRVVRGERSIDLESLKKSVLYTRGASPAHGVVQRFWAVVDAFDQLMRAKLLTFWSGSPLPPVFGFESKHRSMNADTACWYIDVDPRMKADQCPMANTCDRRLIIPDYPTVDGLKQKLLVALEHGAVGYDRM